jgi:hypothetical protein
VWLLLQLRLSLDRGLRLRLSGLLLWLQQLQLSLVQLP